MAFRERKILEIILLFLYPLLVVCFFSLSIYSLQLAIANKLFHFLKDMSFTLPIRYCLYIKKSVCENSGYKKRRNSCVMLSILFPESLKMFLTSWAMAVFLEEAVPYNLCTCVICFRRIFFLYSCVSF